MVLVSAFALTKFPCHLLTCRNSGPVTETAPEAFAARRSSTSAGIRGLLPVSMQSRVMWYNTLAQMAFYLNATSASLSSPTARTSGERAATRRRNTPQTNCVEHLPADLPPHQSPFNHNHFCCCCCCSNPDPADVQQYTCSGKRRRHLQERGAADPSGSATSSQAVVFATANRLSVCDRTVILHFLGNGWLPAPVHNTDRAVVQRLQGMRWGRAGAGASAHVYTQAQSIPTLCEHAVLYARRGGRRQ